MYVDLEDQPHTKEKPAFLWLAIFLLVIVVIQTIWMPARDEAVNEAERAFYAASGVVTGLGGRLAKV